MTYADIFLKIVSEASGLPVEHFRGKAEVLKFFGPSTRLYEEVPDKVAEALLEKLRQELPQIRAWLITGDFIPAPPEFRQ